MLAAHHVAACGAKATLRAVYIVILQSDIVFSTLWRRFSIFERVPHPRLSHWSSFCGVMTPTNYLIIYKLYMPGKVEMMPMQRKKNTKDPASCCHDKGV